jgi:hypothetical protein
LLSVIFVAVVPHQTHVLHKLRSIGVAVVTQLFLNCAQIHRFANDVKVVHYIVFDWIYWLREVVCSFQLHAVRQYLLNHLLPTLWLYIQTLLWDRFWIGYVFLELWPLQHQLLYFLESEVSCFAIFIQKHNLESLFGLLALVFLPLRFPLTLLYRTAAFAEFFGLFELRGQVFYDFGEFKFADLLDCCFALGVSDGHICTFFDQQTRHIQMFHVVERSLPCQFVLVIHSFYF